ncbi:PRA1 protein B4 [Dionaea muscipula]
MVCSPPHPSPPSKISSAIPFKFPETIFHQTKFDSSTTPPNRKTMASSAPPILPISTATTPAAAGQTQAPIATPAFRSYITYLSDQVRNGLAQRRPWCELLDRSALSKPESLSDASHRVWKNYSYFRVNYLSLIALVLSFSLLSHPGSLLLLLGLLAAWIFLYLFRPSDPPLVLLGRTFSERETLGALVVLSVVVIFLTSVGSVLISALMVGISIVCVHGAFRVPEDLFLDEQDPAAPTTGFLSILGGAVKNGATSAAPAVVARV